MATRVLPLFLLAILVGCSNKPPNPSFPITFGLATDDLNRMRQTPKLPQRAIVVSAGYFDPGIASSHLGRRLREFTHQDAQIIAVAYTGTETLDDAADRLIQRVQEAFPNQNPDVTVPVDVVGVSMGGLVARRAADVPGSSGRRLNANRIFTIVTPHRGANLAGANSSDVRVQQMAPGSMFLKQLTPPDQATYEKLYPYARLDDWIVGEANTAPWGENPWWVTNMPFEGAHLFAYRDRRIVADIARHLRGETPWLIEPPTPLPRSTERYQETESSEDPGDSE